MNKQPILFRSLSVVLLAAYLSCLLPSPAAQCRQAELQRRFQELMDGNTSTVPPVTRYSLRWPASCTTSETAAFSTERSGGALTRVTEPFSIDGTDESGMRITPGMRLLSSNVAVSRGHTIGYAIGQPEGGTDDSEAKPWYRKWWFIGLGAAVVAGTVALIASGGDDAEPVPDKPLPGFPDPPAPAFR